MIISGTGAQTPISWDGGTGTISIAKISTANNLPTTPSTIAGNPPIPTIPGVAGDWNGAIIEIEVSYNGGNNWQKCKESGTTVQFEEGVVEHKNFMSSACKIRANIVTGTPSGTGLLFGVNPA